MVRGIAFYAGNWPTTISISLVTSSNNYAYGYAGGIVGLSILGSVVQLILFRKDDKNDDDYM